MNAVQAVYADHTGMVLHCPECGRRNRLSYKQAGRSFRCGSCRNEFPPMRDPVEVPSEEAFDALIRDCALPVLVDFWASWCGPCKMVAPELVKVAAEGAGRWLVAKVSTEELPGVAGRFNISAIPTLVLFRDGREVARQSGAMPAAAIRQFITQAT